MRERRHSVRERRRTRAAAQTASIDNDEAKAHGEGPRLDDSTRWLARSKQGRLTDRLSAAEMVATSPNTKKKRSAARRRWRPQWSVFRPRKGCSVSTPATEPSPTTSTMIPAVTLPPPGSYVRASGSTSSRTIMEEVTRMRRRRRYRRLSQVLMRE